jgi:hypothetical protein
MIKVKKALIRKAGLEGKVSGIWSGSFSLRIFAFKISGRASEQRGLPAGFAAHRRAGQLHPDGSQPESGEQMEQ